MSKARSPAGRQLRIGVGLVRYAARATLRNRAGYFFSFVFPLVFVAGFGLIDPPPSPLEIGVGEAIAERSPLLRELEARGVGGLPLRLVRAPEPELRALLARRRLAAALLPAGGRPDRLRLLVAAGDGDAGALAASLVRGAAAELSLRAAGIPARLHLETEPVPGRRGRHIDYALPGQMGFSLLSLATFSIGFSLATLRQTLVLKRMTATAVRPLTFVVALGVSRSFQGLVQSAALLAVGVGLFRFHLAHGWLTAAEMLLLSYLGIVSFLGYGILISNLAPDEQSLPVLLNLFTLPQVFVSGVFFPPDLLPAWVAAIGDRLPLAYLTGSLRAAAEGAALPGLWPSLLGMFAWGSAAYLLAARTFRIE